MKIVEPYLDYNFPINIEQVDNRLQRESELILGYELLRNQYGLQKDSSRKKSKGRPDFLFEYAGKKIWIEVVTPSRISDEKFGFYEEIESDIKEYKIRMSSDIGGKKDGYTEYQNKNIVALSDIKIICLNTYNLNPGMKSCPFIASVLYGKKEVWVVDPATHKVETEFLTHELISKSNGTEIDMGLFDQVDYQFIDGVLWFDYSLGTICPEKCNILFLANQGRREKFGDLFSHWERIFYENDKCLI